MATINGRRRERTGMTAKEYLGRARAAMKRVEMLEERKANLQWLCTDTANHLRETPGNHGADLQKNERLIAEIDSVERELEEARREAENIRNEIGIMICRISNPLTQKILMLYYLENKTWNDVAGLIKYGVAQMHRYRESGYVEIEKMLEDQGII